MSKALIALFLVSLILAVCTVQTPEDGLELDARAKEIQNEINNANYCESDSDCRLVGDKCPFGCFIYVNKREMQRIKAMVDSYQSTCMYACIQCVENAKCINNKCQSQCA